MTQCYSGHMNSNNVFNTQYRNMYINVGPFLVGGRWYELTVSMYHFRSHQARLSPAKGLRGVPARRHQPVRRGVGEDQQPGQHLPGPQPAGREAHLQQ